MFGTFFSSCQGVIRLTFLFIPIFCAFGCWDFSLDNLSSLTDRQPQVIAVEPPLGKSASPLATLVLTFSQPLDGTTRRPEAVPILFKDSCNFREAIATGGMATVPGAYLLSEDQKQVTFQPASPLLPGDYWIGVTPKLMSTEHLPFNQTPGETPTPFVGEFQIEGEIPASSQMPTPSPNSTGPQAPAGSSAPKTETTTPPSVRLSEIYYDAPGSDLNGYLFLELSGEAGVSLSGYLIYLINGDDGKITQTLTLQEGATIGQDGFYVVADAITQKTSQSHVLAADWVVNFDPQNGPDCIQLVSPGGELLDAIGYGSPLVTLAENGLACYETNPTTDVLAGTSLARREPFEDSDDNRQDWTTQPVPSPR
jgi:hypothetical protein